MAAMADCSRGSRCQKFYPTREQSDSCSGESQTKMEKLSSLAWVQSEMWNVVQGDNLPNINIVLSSVFKPVSKSKIMDKHWVGCRLVNGECKLSNNLICALRLGPLKQWLNIDAKQRLVIPRKALKILF
jgi:hypothetical protein